VVRSRLPGDLFQPLGQSKPSKLKDFLIRRKIPKENRGQLPLIISQRKIIWVGSVAVSENVKVSDQTKRFLKLELIDKRNGF